MPAAKPKRSKKYATIGRKREKVFSPEVDRLLTYLIETEVLSDLISGHHKGAKGFSTGEYDPGKKSIAVLAGDAEQGDEAAAHEIVHLLAGRESKVDRMSKEMESLPWLMKRDLVFPKHWTEKGLADIPSRRMTGKIKQMTEGAARRRLGDVRNSISEGSEWSGIPPTSKGMFIHRNAPEEGSAYYMTEVGVAKPMGERAKEFGMYLLNHGVPMKLVEPVVKRLSGLAKPGKSYSGGSYELDQLVKKKENNPGFNK